MAGYPPASVLNTRDFKWTVLGNGTWALGGAGNYNHIHPILPDVTTLKATWTGNTIRLTWPASPGAAGYHATFMNWAFVTSSEMFTPVAACVGTTCTGTADVSQIPFGTVHVRLEGVASMGCARRVSRQTRSRRVPRLCPRRPCSLPLRARW